jgi:hypothetical protein
MFAQQNDVTSRIALALNLERAVRFADAIPEYEIILAAIPNAVGVIPTRSQPHALQTRNDDRFGTIALFRKNSNWNTPVLHDRFEQYFITGLRAAGMPEK